MDPKLEQTDQQGDDEVVLVDEEGKHHRFQVVDIIEVDNRDYALLLPAEAEDTDDADTDEVLVLRFEEDQFVMIEDEAEFQRVVQVLEEMNDDDEE